MLLVDPASVLRVGTAWHPATRLAFRFFATYFVLYVVTTQMLPGMVGVEMPNLGELPPVRTIVSWVASHVFRVSYPLVITGSGSDDKTYDWVHAFTVLSLSVLITVMYGRCSIAAASNMRDCNSGFGSSRDLRSGRPCSATG